MSNNTNQAKVALIMAGGTGGHVFPALAVADLMRESGVCVHWLGTSAGIESRIVPAADIKLHCIDVHGLRGKGKLGLLKAPWLVIKAIFQARKIFKQIKPDIVLGMGGFASGPGAVAAKLSGTPLVIHEQNAKAGMTNKISRLLAKRTLAAFPGAFNAHLSTNKDAEKGIEIVGNPVRGPILEMQGPAQRYSQRAGKLNVLIVGGSLGATAINDIVPRTIQTMPLSERPNVWHQAGARNIQATSALYDSCEVEADVTAFIDNMDQAYAWADLVVCRSGALTVSELAIAGVASILIPFPFAVDDHQSANGEFLADAGAALIVQQRDLSIEKFLSILNDLKSRDRLQTMAEKAISVAAPNASHTVAKICLEEML